MIKKIRNFIGDGATFVLGFLFALVAAPVIHLSGLDKVDSCPTPEEIRRSQRFADELKRERAK